MPFTYVCVNCEVPRPAKVALAHAIQTVFCETMKTFSQHNHVRILDNEFISYAADYESPAALVQVKAADGSISKEAREKLVGALSAALPAHIPCLSGDRIYILFESLPVDHIAVGNTIMKFDTMRTARSAEAIAEVAP